MKNLNLLRSLVETQQYELLKQQSQKLYDEGLGISSLPLLSLAQAQLGQLKSAIQTLSLADTVKDQMDIDALVDLGAAYIVLFKIDEAIDLLKTIVKNYPQHALALARLGLCYMSKNEPEKACELFERSLILSPQRIAVAIHLITLSIHLKELVRAQQFFTQAYESLSQIQADLPKEIAVSHRQRLEMLQLQLWVQQLQFSKAEQWLDNRQESLGEDDYAFWLSHYATALAEIDKHAQAEDVLKEGLKKYSKNLHLVLQLSDLALIQGRTTHAIYLIEQGIKEDQDNPSLWSRLSNICVNQFEQRAHNAAEKAIKLSNNLTVSDDYPPERITALRLQAKNALALVKSHQQEYAEAETLFNELLTDNPHFVPALRGLGQQLMQQGRIDDAVKHYEHLKIIDPVSGHTALINARQFPEDIETLEKLDKAARIPSLEGSVRSGILFQLASAFEKRNNYDQAFAYAKEANEISKRFLHYNHKTHRKECARIRYAFSSTLYQHRPDCGVSSTLPVYVLGMPRSGTTLVEQIIAGHSQIFGAGELGAISCRIQGLNRWERHVGSGRQYPDCVDDLTPYVIEGIAKDILKELQDYAPDAKHIVDKLPHNFEHIGFIKFIFPKAKIISVRRDPRDIALSNYFTDYQAKHGGMGFAYDLTQIGEQLADHNLMMHHWQQVFPNEILEINYEDVVDNLEGNARKMLAYIGVDWEPEVLNFNKLERSIKTASVWQVRQPIYKTSKAKWKNYEKYLEPLIRGTNAKIKFNKIKMLSLPEPGFLTDGVDLYHKGELDAAELSFKKMLHHNPDHAACNYMTGLVYLSKGYMKEGVEQIKIALEKCPWQKEWSENLKKALSKKK